METINVKGKLVFTITSKQHWINSFPGALPKLPMVEEYLFVDANGNIASCGEDFMYAEEINTYPINVYLVSRISHNKQTEYAAMYRRLLGINN